MTFLNLHLLTANVTGSAEAWPLRELPPADNEAAI